MSREHFEEDCEDCRPAAIDMHGKRVPDSHPLLVAAHAVFDAMTLSERQAWHRVTCLNSRASKDLAVVYTMKKRVEKLCKEKPT